VNEQAMRDRVAAIDSRLPACRTELLALADGDLDETATARFDELETEHGTLATERETLSARLGRIDTIRETARNANDDAAGDGDDDGEGDEGQGGAGRGNESGGNDRGRSRSRRARLDPFADLDRVRSDSVPRGDLRARAMTAIERLPEFIDDDQRQRATLLLQRGDRHGRIARHMLLTGSDAYMRAFERLLAGEMPYQLEDDELVALRTAEAHRAAMAEGSGSTGGYLVPFYLDPSIILTNAGSTNPIRQMARVEAIATNTWHGVSSAGVTAAWLAESTEAADASPSVAQPAVPTEKGSAYLQASFEVTQDTNIVSQIGMLLQDARDNLEATAFAVGTGSGQPKGVVTAVAAVGGSVVTDTHASTPQFLITDVYNVKAALPPRHRPNASWLASEAIYLLVRQFATGSGPQHAFWADLGMATPPLLIGRPAQEASSMDSTVANGKNILLVGDFKKYLVVDRIGMTVQYEPLVIGANRRPTGEVGWFCHWRTGGDALDPNAFRLLQIVTT
jgi:HK97 family phage major capsid protein